MMANKLRNFLFPELNRKLFIRSAIVAMVAFVVFKFILIPFRISGFSMVPTYHNGDVNFCFTMKYFFSAPQKTDIVTVRFAGNRVMLLKRIIATEGETVEFRDGYLYVSGTKISEPYVTDRQKWNLSPRTVKKDRVYVVGDNRNVPMKRHHFGQTSINRIVGAPLW